MGVVAYNRMDADINGVAEASGMDRDAVMSLPTSEFVALAESLGVDLEVDWGSLADYHKNVATRN